MIAREKPQSPLMRLPGNVKNPPVILLTALCVLSYLADDFRATVFIFVMIVLGVALRFHQEMRDAVKLHLGGDGMLTLAGS